MDSRWDVDHRYAISTIKEVKDCIEVLTRRRMTEERSKYIAMTRAKLSTLRKTINNLEHSLRDMPGEMVKQKRGDLEIIKRTQDELEKAMERQSNYVELPEAQQNARNFTLNQLDTPELYDHRSSLLRAQDRELDMLDTTADAIKSISTHIRDEVELQSGLLGDLESAVDTSHVMVAENRTAFTRIIENSNKGRLMFYIVILTTVLGLQLIF